MLGNYQKMGGLAALAEALCYIIGFAIFVFLLDIPGNSRPVENLEFLIDNRILIISTMSIIYIFAALILTVLVLALHDRLKTESPIMMQVATAIGLIWAGVVVASGMIFNVGAESVISIYASDPERAATLWLAVGIVQNGLGGGIELLGGVWILIISWTGLKSGIYPKFLNYFGIIIGCAGVLSVAPAWGVFVEIFGLSQIIWFIWLGMVMLRDETVA
ncbi:hypothetical protein [Parasphingorhabdus sp.]|uniref:hypothetical protein n=1 Tax=Parasphingorhabdus sp. TaxID=2709688 RepID=UPI003D2D263A